MGEINIMQEMSDNNDAKILTKKEKIFRNIIANAVIIFVVVMVFLFSFQNSIITVLEDNPERPIYRGDAEKKNISLMINVYSGTEYIDDFLQTLKQHNAKATFFIGGAWAADNVEVLKRIYAEGHEIANHGYFNKDHKKLDVAKNKLEILNTERQIEKLIGIKTNLFSPPNGSFSNETLEVAEELGYKVIMWSKDTNDLIDKDKYIVYTRATKDIQNGDLILMHPTKHTLNVLSDILSYYGSYNFKAVTVSNNIGL